MEVIKNIRIKESTYNELRELAHPGQSFDGVIRELLEKLKATAETSSWGKKK